LISALIHRLDTLGVSFRLPGFQFALSGARAYVPLSGTVE